MRVRRGFTLMETLVVLLLASMLMTSLATVISLSLHYWTQGDEHVLAEKNARVAMSSIVTELRQAVACDDTGVGANPPRGYWAITPPVPPTALLYPNSNPPNNSGTQLWFTEAVPSYDPFADGMAPNGPQYYQQVRYHILSGVIYREVTTFSASGGVASLLNVPVAQASSQGSISMAVQWLAANAIHISITAQEVDYAYTLQSNAFTQ